MRIKNIIIGAGLSGAILSNILKEDYLILESKKTFGGEMFNNILGPKMIHRTAETSIFFNCYIITKRLISTKTLKDGIECNDKSIYDKKMGYSFNNSKNNQNDEFDALSINWKYFYDDIKIQYNVRILNIDFDKHIIYALKNDDLIKYEYENLISTIDLFNFIKLTGLAFDLNLLKTKGVIYINFNGKYNIKNEKLFKYDFWYNLTDNEFFRCTKLDNSYTIEVYPEHTNNIYNQISKYFDINTDFQKPTFYYNPNAKIWSLQEINFDLFASNNIYLLGRNALYNHDRIQDSIKIAYEILKKVQGDIKSE